MIKNKKAKGARAERKVRDYLKEQGYYVTKAGGSLGLWDIMAIPTSGMDKLLPVVVQVKCNSNPPKKEMEALRACDIMADKVVAIVHDRKGIEWNLL